MHNDDLFQLCFSDDARNARKYLDIKINIDCFSLSILLVSMLLPTSLLRKILLQRDIWNVWLKYRKCLIRHRNCVYRKKFLVDCLTNDLIPGFLQFRVPENGCFEETIVHNFQRRLLRKELAASLRAIEEASNRLDMQRLTIATMDLPEHNGECSVPGALAGTKGEQRNK